MLRNGQDVRLKGRGALKVSAMLQETGEDFLDKVIHRAVGIEGGEVGSERRGKLLIKATEENTIFPVRG